MTTIYLIRHAEAEGNLYRRMHGHTDGMITAKGMDQIRALAERFTDIPVDACYASDLTRTRTTAQAVYVPKGLPLQTDTRFREVYVGIWENVPFGQLYAEEPEALACFIQRPDLWQVEDSEPYEVYTGRFLEALEEAAKNHDGQSVAVVTHSVVLQGVIRRLFPECPWKLAPNTGVTKLEYENGQYRLIYLYDASHLDEQLGKGYTLAREQNLWFRPGLTEIEGLQPPAAEEYFTCLSGQQPVGILCLDSVDEKTGQLTYMGLLAGYRGTGAAVQLVGKAIFRFREQGRAQMCIRRPETGAMDRIFERMQLKADENGRCVMDIRRRVLPL